MTTDSDMVITKPISVGTQGILRIYDRTLEIKSRSTATVLWSVNHLY